MSSFYTNVEKYGNTIYWRGYQNGVSFARKTKYKPTLYLKSQEPTKFKSLKGEHYLAPREFDTMNDARDFVEGHKGIAGFEIFGNTNYQAQFMQEKFPGKINYDMSKINIFSFDIEVDISTGFADIENADKMVTSISMKSSKRDTYWVLGQVEYDKSETITGIPPEDIQYIKCKDEETLLKKFIDIWKYEYPDVVTGWNVELFDVQYIVTRIIRILGEAKARELSPWGRLKTRTIRAFGREQPTYTISGVTIIDYMDAFKKFGYKYGTQESYKLDHIAHVVLGEKKLSYDEYGSLTSLYEKNPQLYIDYNIKDTHLIQRFEDETGLIALVLAVAYGGGVNYTEAFGTVGIWDTTIYRRLMIDNIVPWIKKSPPRERDEIVGGYVKDPVPGIYKWVVSFDLNSLYPHLMMQYNMSPETYMDDKRVSVSPDMVLDNNFANTDRDEYSVAANGACFTNKKRGVIPSIIEEYYAERAEVKVEMLRVEQLEVDETDHVKKQEYRKQIVQLHNKQMSIKIAMNSLYGATANLYFIYYIQEMAEGITMSGQLSIRYVAKALNEYLNKILSTVDVDYVLYADTDSVYIVLDKLIEKVYGTSDVERKIGEDFLDKVCASKLEKVIEKTYEDLAVIMGSYENRMVMKREKINDRALFVAKKRYILNTLNSEGVHYETPKVSVTGMESVRSSTPEIVRTKLKQAYAVMMNEGEAGIQDYINEFRGEFSSLSAEEISKNTGTDDINKFTDKNTLYRKGTPIHYRGCIVYNNHLTQSGMDANHEPIKSGDKVKFVYLRLPNPLRENVVAFPQYLPKELGLNDYIDYDTQFEKVFLKPIRNVLEPLGWEEEETSTIDNFFM